MIPDKQPPVTPPNAGNVVTCHKVWWLVLVAGWVAFPIVFPLDPNNPDIHWATVLGSAVGMCFVALVLASIPWLVLTVARSRMTTVQFMATLTVATGLAMGSRIIVFTHEKKMVPVTVGVGSVFAPETSDFAVTFSAEPTVEEFEAVTTDGVRLKGKRAELSVPAYFQRVEVVPMPRGFSDRETKESALSKLREYAVHNGITSAEFKFESSTLGRQASMRGTKLLEDAGKPKAVTYVAVVYYGESSLFSVYAGSLSESYPPTCIVEFLQSVRKNPR